MLLFSRLDIEKIHNEQGCEKAQRNYLNSGVFRGKENSDNEESSSQNEEQRIHYSEFLLS